jgi:hypothetical protein
MRAEVVERRQAVVSRLLALRADGRLQSQVVRAAAESLGVTERTVWRWLAAASHDPRWRIGWRTTDEAVEAFYRTGGRPTAAWHLLRDEGIPVPSHTAFCLGEIVQRVRDGRLRTNIGNVATLDDAGAALNPTERSNGKTIIRIRP